jgi:ribulose-5-phosphate 4-epimerase/fuculose-1-phosphate aldolase
MTIHRSIAAASALDFDEATARVYLAAVYRLIEHLGWGEGIYNHISLRLPAEPTRFLVKRHEQLYREVTASNLVKVDMTEDLDEASGVNRPGFTLHGGILMARPDVNCAIHLHTVEGIAISAHKGGLRMMSQNAIRFYKRIGYHPYEGITDDFGERERIVANLGQAKALLLENHGLLTVSATPWGAFTLMRDLMMACKSQLLLEATQAGIKEVPPDICEKVALQFDAHDQGRGTADWPSWLRLLDSIDQSYRW